MTDGSSLIISLRVPLLSLFLSTQGCCSLLLPVPGEWLYYEGLQRTTISPLPTLFSAVVRQGQKGVFKEGCMKQGII